MEKFIVADAPPTVSHYRLDDGRCYRIVLVLITKEAELPTAQYIEVETRGYEVDEAGTFVTDANMEPVMLRPQRARIPLDLVRAGVQSVKPGWIRVDEEPAADMEPLDELPTSLHEVGDRVNVRGQMFHYTHGLYEDVRCMRVQDIAPMVAPIDPDALRL